MFIHEDDVQRVIEETDIVGVIQRRVDLKKSSRTNWKGLCPFHAEKTPSFSVSQDKGLYHCFGCKESGNVITWLREVEHLEFQEAIEQLAEPLGVKLRYVGGDADGAARQRNKRLMTLLAEAADYYHQQLLSSKEAGKARAYLRERGYDKDIVVKYQLGYAPRSRTHLAAHFLTQFQAKPDASSKSDASGGDIPSEIMPELLELANLAYVSQPEAGSQSADPIVRDRSIVRDRFSERVMFPIADTAGNTVGFGGRLLPDGRGPKYLNSAQTPVYDKSRVLYGLDIAKRAISTQDFVLICEGYTDVIGFCIAGFDNAVATCGTALTEQHVKQLSKFTKRFFLAFDADSAGTAATERVHLWEREYDLDVAVVELAEGQDPGQLAITDAAALQQAVKDATSLFSYRADRVLERHDLDQPATRERAADELARVVAVYPADLLTDADVEPFTKRLPMETADFMVRVDKARQQLEEESAKAAARDAARERARQQQSGQSGRQQSGSATRESYPPDDSYDAPLDVLAPDIPPPDFSSPDFSSPGFSAAQGFESTRNRPAERKRPVDRNPSPAEIEALMALKQRGEELLPYLLPAMFLHPVTKAAFHALCRQYEGKLGEAELGEVELSEADQQALQNFERSLADYLHTHQPFASARDEASGARDEAGGADEENASVANEADENEMSDLSIWQAVGGVMAAAVDRVSRIPKSKDQLQAASQFRERVITELRGSLNSERIRELLTEAVAWLAQQQEPL